MGYDTIVLENRGRVAIITFNRPEKMNAINFALRQDFAAALDEVDGDSDIDVLVLTGNGRAFCAGVDLKELEKKADDETLSAFPSIWDQLRTFPKPTIAAVNGFAITGGFELALCCDMIIASQEAMFADTHARVGVLPGGGMTQLLPRLVGMNKAKEMSFTGNYLNADQALRFGLVNSVVPAGELMDLALKLAADIVSNDQTAVRKIKEIINRGEGMTLEDAIRMEQFEHLLHRSSATAAEVHKRRTGITKRGRSQAQEIKFKKP